MAGQQLHGGCTRCHAPDTSRTHRDSGRDSADRQLPHAWHCNVFPDCVRRSHGFLEPLSRTPPQLLDTAEAGISPHCQHVPAPPSELRAHRGRACFVVPWFPCSRAVDRGPGDIPPEARARLLAASPGHRRGVVKRHHAGFGYQWWRFNSSHPDVVKGDERLVVTRSPKPTSAGSTPAILARPVL